MIIRTLLDAGCLYLKSPLRSFFLFYYLKSFFKSFAAV